MATVIGTGSAPGEIGVLGESQEAEGVRGVGHKGAGVSGTSDKWIGTYGESQEAEGVRGVGHKGAGVSGTSDKWVGVYGETAGIENAPAGVWGEHKGAGVGVRAVSNSGVALLAFSNEKAAVLQGDVEVTGSLAVQGADLLDVIADLINHTDIEPVVQLDDHGADVSISGRGFTRLGLIHVVIGYQLGNASFQNGPAIARASVHGEFAGVVFRLTGGTQATRIEVRAEDLVSGTSRTETLRFAALRT